MLTKPHYKGIYPTIIIVLVSLQKTIKEANKSNVVISANRDLEDQSLGTHISFTANPQSSSVFMGFTDSDRERAKVATNRV